MRRIGILGGMGPEATILIMQKVLAAVAAQDDSDHIPLIVDQNTQVPSRIKHLLEGGSDDPGPVLACMARRLELAGAEALAMPCNTAHHYADAIRSAATVPFLDMISLSVAYAKSLCAPGGAVGILGSPALHRAGVFDAHLAQDGLVPVYPAEEDGMLAAIRRIKAEGPGPAARATLLAASHDLLARGAAVQMIACTEFSLITESVAPDAMAFDTLDRLVDAIVSHAGPAQT